MLKVATGGGVQELLSAQNSGEKACVVTRLTDECRGKDLGGERATVLVGGNAVDGLVEVDQFAGEIASTVVTCDADKYFGALAVRYDVVTDRAGRSLSDLASFAGTQKNLSGLGLRSRENSPEKGVEMP